MAEAHAVNYQSFVEELIRVVPALEYGPLTGSVWTAIRDEGLDDEMNAKAHTMWVMARLPLNDEMVAGLQNFDDFYIEAFNAFDIVLKERFEMSIIDLIDYDAGTVTLVKLAS